MRDRGQLLVELAVALPVILFTILGGVEAGFLIIAKAQQDRTTAVVAEWAAGHPGDSWHAIATKELAGCDVSVEEARGLTTATARCMYSPAIFRMFTGLPMSSREVAATYPPSSDPEPSPVASPS